MRIGLNPVKVNNTIEHPFTHRVLVPIYIPELAGYNEHALEVLKMCLGSLLKTVHEKTAITLINNCCCSEVRVYLRELSESGQVDQLIENQRNLGKIDALFNVVKGCYEPLITITDADVLFANGWQQAAEKAYSEYPELGMLCPTPIPDNTFYFTSATFWKGWLSGKISFSKEVDAKGMELFALSIGKKDEELKKLLDRNTSKLCYQAKGKSLLCVGAGHFVATMRRETFGFAPDEPSGKAILGNSEVRYIDEPVDIAGYVRASLPKAMAYHMGNVPEKWMEERFNALEENVTVEFELPAVKPLKTNYWLRRKIIRLMKKRFSSCR